MESLVILTYDHPHRKTEDVVFRLLLAGYKPESMHLLAFPWIERKERPYIYSHRPAEATWPAKACSDPRSLSANLHIPFRVVEPADMLAQITSENPQAVIVGGAGLLDGAIVRAFPVLNVHPGLLPRSRGLDILKWTILELEPVGVTAHLCDERADLGHRIAEARVPVYHSDTFHSLAQRQYEMELDLIVPALIEVLSSERSSFKPIVDDGHESRRRMPRRTEAGLLEAFERYKRVYAGE